MSESGFFDGVVLAVANNKRVQAGLFVLFDFATAQRRLWEGDFNITVEGDEWQGIGRRVDDEGSPLQRIEGLEVSINGQAPTIKFVMSGVDSQLVEIAAIDQANDEIEGRDVVVYIVFFDEEAQPLSAMMEMGTWEMQRPGFTHSGPQKREIYLDGETLLAQRNRSPNGLLSDWDQKRRYPDDRGLERMYFLRDAVRIWPRF